MKIQNIQTLIEQRFTEMQEIRRFLHMHPELSYEEFETANYICAYYDRLGIPYERNVGGNGIVARIEGALPGRTVALRADFDALPIQEETGVSYQSTVPNVSHACGHDGHTATLLIVAKTLFENREQLAGTYIMLHQHAEEITPGGAKAMVAAGCLEGVDAVFGTHLWSQFESGSVQTCPGPMMAGADRFVLKVTGAGGHGAMPHTTIDAIALTAQIVSTLQQIVARRINPTSPAVLTVGSFHSGDAFNIIAGTAEITGTVRTFSTEVRENIVFEMERIIKGLCDAAGASFDFEYTRGHPPVINHPEMAKQVLTTASTIPGVSSVQVMEANMVGEDFSYYLNEKPGSFFFTGAKPTDGPAYPHHHPKFNFDEKAMVIAGKTLATLATNFASESVVANDFHI
ncbi:MAG: amidohydrolase [Kurthia sp.]|nr:amidohydrolase [Candidatus Kurthia equi]